MQRVPSNVLPGAYSTHYRQQQKDHVTTLQHFREEDKADILARTKRIQNETNRRRKAIAIKRKLEAQREEKRRQEILAKRREAQREATERFQRGPASKHVRGRAPSPGSIHIHSAVPTLEEALYAARGTTSRGTSSQGPGQRSQSAKVTRHVYGDSEQAEHRTKARAASAGQQHHTTSDLHSKSLRNLNNSRSLFEQQLEQHQQLLMEQQQETLAKFNQAIQAEIEEDQQLQGTTVDERSLSSSDSLSSLDSLEEGRRARNTRGVSKENYVNNTNGSPSYVLSHKPPYPSGTPLTASTAVSNTGYASKGTPSSTYTTTIYHPHPPIQPPPRNTSPRSAAILSNHNNQTYQANYNHSVSSTAVVPAPLFSTASVSSPNSSPAQHVQRGHGSPAPLQRSHSSPTMVAVVQPNNAQVSDDLDLPTKPRTTEHKDAWNKNYQVSQPQYDTNGVKGAISEHTSTASQYSQGKAGAYGSASTYNTKQDQFSSSRLDQYVGDRNYESIHNQTYTVGRALVDHQPTSVQPPHSTYGSTSGLVNHDGAMTYGQPVNAWSGKATGSTYQDNAWKESDANKSMASATQSDVSKATAASYARLYTNKDTQVNGKSVTNYTQDSSSSKPSEVMPSSYGVTPPSTQNLLNAIDAMSKTLQKSPANKPSGRSGRQAPQPTEDQEEGGYTSGSRGNQDGARGYVPRPSEGHTGGTGGYVPRSSEGHTRGTGGYVPRSRSQDQVEEVEEESTSGEEEDAKPKKKEIKGILKKQPGGPRTNQLGVKGLRASISTGALRDSLEVAHNTHHHHRPKAPNKASKKSVRWTDLVYEEESLDSGEDPMETAGGYQAPQPSPREESNLNVMSGGQKKSKLRPFSAKEASTTPKVDPTVRNPRAASAGATRRGPFVRPHPPPGKPQGAFRNHVYGNQNGGGGNQFTNSGGTITMNTWTSGENTRSQYSLTNTGNNMNNTFNGTPSSLNQKQNDSSEAVYDTNGLRLDRTPTDEEINWLWDKVRTCLHKNGPSENQQKQPGKVGESTAKRGMAVSQKFIDGNSLAPQYQAATRISTTNMPTGGGAVVTTNTTSTTLTSNGSYPRRTQKISMNTLSNITQRAPASATRRQGAGAAAGDGSQSSAAGAAGRPPGGGYQVPKASAALPAQRQAGNMADVSESMAGFLTAERLAEHSLADSEIERAMQEAELRQQAHNASRPAQHVPSALSIEEQRLQHSLDRLNERLRAITDAAGMGPTGMFVPRPPPCQNGSFRGHQPIRKHLPSNGSKHTSAGVLAAQGTRAVSVGTRNGYTRT